MKPHRIVWLIPVLGFLVAARAADPDPELIDAEKTLQEAKIEAAGPVLLRFLRDRTLTDADRARLSDAVRRLGDDDFETREKAVEDLIRAGRKALPFLLPAQRDKDPERARRAAHCVTGIGSGAESTRITAVIRVLADRHPEGATAVLLAYVLGAEEEVIEEAVQKALLTLVTKDGKPDAVLVKALTDKEPLCRATAAYALGRGAPGQRDAIRRLFTDAEPRVRFEAADALLRVGDKEAVPVLIALLGEGPMTFGGRAQELLARIAGEKAPTAFLSEATPDKRTAVADAWRGWWKDAGPRTDLAKIKLDETLLGINLICEIPPNESQGIVWACRADGKKLWEIRDVNAPVDAQLLPNGNVLIAEWGSTQVAERDRSGKVVWSHKLNQVPTSCRRLPNGNTFIGTYGEVLEVDPKGNVVYSYKDPNGGSCYRAHRLPNGHVVFATSNSTIVELDAKGMLVRSVKTPIPTNDWTSIDPLPGGRFLLAVRSSQKVIEIDTDGKIVWERTVRDPMAVARLPNGNTLVSSYFMNGEVIEIDRAGKDVWKLKIETRPFCARRF